MRKKNRAIPGALGLLLATGAAGPAAAEGVEGLYSDNVVVILDASGSMWGKMKGTSTTKMKAAKQALLAVLSKVPATTQVGLLVFPERRDRKAWVYPLGKRDDARLKAAIMAPTPNGSTPLGQFMKMGADRLLQERKAQLGYGTYRLLVVTDGEASDAELMNKFAPEIVSRGITMDAIGVAMKKEHTLAKLANSYRRADDPASLQKAVSEVFAEVSTQGTGTAASLAADFDLLAPLSPEHAVAAIGALSRSGDHPIGARPGATGGN